MSIAASKLYDQKNWSHAVDASISPSLFLMPGALYIGNEVEEVKTLLGSCVAVTLWHPQDRLLAMTHIVLPSSQTAAGPRYATGAIAELTRVTQQRGYRPAEFVTCMYGGGMMFTTENDSMIDVGRRNVETTRELLSRAGFRIQQSDVFGPTYRHITIRRTTGEVLLKSTDVAATMG